MISYFIFLQHSQGRAIALRLNHREWGGYFEMVSVFVLPGPKAVSGSQCGGKKPGSFLFFFLFCKMHFLPNVKNWTSMWKPRESHIWPSACHHVCSPAVILGLLLENLCLLFSFVSHFIQHWHLSAASCTHQWSSWLIYKCLHFFLKAFTLTRLQVWLLWAVMCTLLGFARWNQSWPQPLSQSELQD